LKLSPREQRGKIRRARMLGVGKLSGKFFAVVEIGALKTGE
jgi:hypothetical protein